ncbi:MAG: hypothetical protein KBC27_02990 [Rickettsiales bacterium]|nr:hypothetical protein [Rickettsiales bacterium]
MIKQNKPVILKNKSCFAKWPFLVVLTVVILVAIYVLFNKDYEVIDFPGFKKPVLESNTGHNSVSNNLNQDKHNATACYNGIYLNNALLFSDLYINFYKGHGIRESLNILHETNFYDKYLDQVVQYLRVLTTNNIVTSEKEIKQSFGVMKLEVLRKYAKLKFQDSSLLSGLFNAIMFYKKGQAALDSGGVEETMERAQMAIDNDKIEEAYALVISIREPEYQDITHPWLTKAGYLIRVTEVLEDTKKYVFSERYSSKFIKTCG